MVSRLMEFERKTLLVQFIAVEPLTFYSTSDGTDLVQDILRAKLARSDADIFGQEGSLSIDDRGEFLSFEPTDTKNRTLHLPIEHLAYCGALRRMRRDKNDERDADQIYRRDFENVDLANRYAQHIIGPPIFVAIFHGFDNALCYTFVTQSADDACLLVMKLMRTFRQHEQQGQINQGSPSPSSIDNERPPSPVIITHGNPLLQSSNALFTDNRHILPPPVCLQTANTTSNMYIQNCHQDDFIQRLLSNSNCEIVNQPYSGSYATRHLDNYPMISAPSSSMCYSSINQPTTIVVRTRDTSCPSSSCSFLPQETFVCDTPHCTQCCLPLASSAATRQQNSPVVFNHSMFPNSGSGAHFIGRSTPHMMRSPSPPIIGFPNTGYQQSYSTCNTLPPQVIYKPSDHDVTYKQKIMVRWLQPPTPPPSAPIIIREIQAAPEVLPPIICRQMAPCPPTPPPIIIREQPPCPPPQRPMVIEKCIPPVCLPRQVIVEQCPPPPPKPQQIIYEKYLPSPAQPRQVIVQRETCQPCQPCQPNVCAPRQVVVQRQICQCCQPCQPCQPSVCVPQQQPRRRLVREIIRQIPQPCLPPCPPPCPPPCATTCTTTCATTCAPTCAPVQPALVCTPQRQQQIVQQQVPVFATRRHIVQPKGIRVIRQVIGPAQPSGLGQVPMQQQQQPQQFYCAPR